MKTYIMGQGTVITGAGIHHGYPAISFGDASKPGVPGEPAPHELENLMENGVSIVMPTLQAAERVLEMVRSAVEQFEAQVRKEMAEKGEGHEDR